MRVVQTWEVWGVYPVEYLRVLDRVWVGEAPAPPAYDSGPRRDPTENLPAWLLQAARAEAGLADPVPPQESTEATSNDIDGEVIQLNVEINIDSEEETAPEVALNAPSPSPTTPLSIAEDSGESSEEDLFS
jgi:hypothetical protein